jgi:hypothetical protein
VHHSSSCRRACPSEASGYLDPYLGSALWAKHGGMEANLAGFWAMKRVSLSAGEVVLDPKAGPAFVKLLAFSKTTHDMQHRRVRTCSCRVTRDENPYDAPAPTSRIMVRDASDRAEPLNRRMI